MLERGFAFTFSITALLQVSLEAYLQQQQQMLSSKMSLFWM